MAWGILAPVKERLTGAIILVALIVLLVPELLTGPPRLRSAGAPPGRAGVVASAAGAAPVRSYTLPLGAGAGARSAALDVVKRPAAAHLGGATPVPAPPVRTSAASPKPKPKPAPAPAAAPKPRPPAPAPVRPAARPVPQTEPRTRAAVAPASKVRPSVSAAPWVVQLGVFAFHADALRLSGRVRARGVPVRIMPLHLSGRLLWKVVTGAVRGRAAGLALQRRLDGFGLKGELLRQ